MTQLVPGAAVDCDLQALHCLLASYEIYGVGHCWPACLEGSRTEGEEP